MTGVPGLISYLWSSGSEKDGDLSPQSPSAKTRAAVTSPSMICDLKVSSLVPQTSHHLQCSYLSSHGLPCLGLKFSFVFTLSLSSPEWTLCEPCPSCSPLLSERSKKMPLPHALTQCPFSITASYSSSCSSTHETRARTS